MELLVPHVCSHCGATDEAKFIFSGPHLKQVCNSCNRYVKFFSKSAVPDITEVKLKIWSLTQGTSFIDAAKEPCGFLEGATGLEGKVLYWRLYLKVREMVEKEKEEML
jgi:hypothetical protein